MQKASLSFKEACIRSVIQNLCTGQKVGNERETRLFPKWTDSPTARRSRVSFLNHFFLSCTHIQNFTSQICVQDKNSGMGKKPGFFPQRFFVVMIDEIQYMTEYVYCDKARTVQAVNLPRTGGTEIRPHAGLRQLHRLDDADDAEDVCRRKAETDIHIVETDLLRGDGCHIQVCGAPRHAGHGEGRRS